MYHSLSLDKRKLFCLFVYRGTLSCYSVSVFSFPIPYGMHLVVLAQLCPFGWYVIPARHFPQKSLSRNLKIGFPLSLLPNHALLPLTHDLIVSCIGWVQAGEVWALRMPLFHVCPKFACCSCICRGWSAQFAIRSWPFSGFLFLMAHPIRGWALLNGGLCFSLSLPFFLLLSPVIPLYHSCCKLFCFNLAGPFWACPLFFP